MERLVFSQQQKREKECNNSDKTRSFTASATIINSNRNGSELICDAGCRMHSIHAEIAKFKMKTKRITFESVVNSIGSTYTFLLALNTTNVGRLAIYSIEKLAIFVKIRVKYESLLY